MLIAKSATEGSNVEFKQAVGNRRSIRYYKPYQPVEREKIQTIFEAARLQCQHGNAGLIRKAVVVTKGETDDAIREELISCGRLTCRGGRA